MRSQYDILGVPQPARNKLTMTSAAQMRLPMIGRIVVALLVLAPCLVISAKARAQDVPGIEICTVEKTMERRTSCLQSNIDFLQKTISKLAADHQQKLDAANRQIESLKATTAGLQKAMDELQAAQKKVTDEATKKANAPPAKDNAPAGKGEGK
jgi:septal ring factor EnvC (AmiA/AmiB activator)